MKLTDFRVLTFDCYGTLIDWETGIHEALRPWLESEGRQIDREQVLVTYAKAEARIEAANPGALYPEILAKTHRDLARTWEISSSDDQAAEFAASVGDWPAFPDSPAALRYLQRHFKLVILSNVDRASFTRSQERLGVIFDAIYTAEEIGGYKPDLRNFHYMLDRQAELGVDKSQILHVAQSLFHDHVPANQLGLANCWIDRRHDKPGGGATMTPVRDVTTDFRATSMAALAEQHRACVGSR
ncbi:MAG: haloacid dehalogenase type II [Sphingomonadales bacterium]